MRRAVAAAVLFLAVAPVARAGDWTRFGYDAARSSSAPSSGGITAANVANLRHQSVRLDGTVDASPIYLHAVRAGGRVRDVFVVTTTYGKTEAIDADTGRVVWRVVPPITARVTGSAQITNATPAADPGRPYVYAAAPDGVVRELRIADGRPVWSTTVTRDPTHEKLTSPLNLAGGFLIVTTGGYIGDAPPYQGHVVTLDPRTGRIRHVWNSLCSDRAAIIVPSSCDASDSAIWGRAGAVVDPHTGNLLVATGNGPWNGTTNWGDSVLELSPDASRLLQNFTPMNVDELERGDVDLGSASPAVIPRPGRSSLVVQGGKDAQLKLLDAARLNGQGGASTRKDGELQTLATPGGAALFSAPTVWTAAGRTWLFVADSGGTAAYLLENDRLRQVWQNGTAGTSPVVVGGLVYVYDMNAGGLAVYRPGGAKPVATLQCGAGHWNSPIVADGRIALPEGNANDHRGDGVLDIWRLPR
jgi:outer membrane protein assembly factor BamB